VAAGVGTEPGRGETGLDVATGVFQSVRHLIELGHRRIAFVGAGPRSPINQQRHTAIQLATGSTDGGEAVRCLRFEPSEISAAEGARLADIVLEDPQPPTAAHVTAREIGEGFFERLIQRGVAVPGDLSLVVEQEDAGEFASLPSDATRVSYDYEGLGERAAELLMAIIAEPRQVQVVDPVPTSLVAGSTTAAPKRARAADKKKL
jgi:LacI family transcriptional regulator